MEASRNVPVLERSLSEGFSFHDRAAAARRLAVPQLKRQATATSTFSQGLKGLSAGGAEKTVFATQAFEELSQEQKLRNFIAVELHQIHVVPGKGKKKRQGPLPGHYEGPETSKEEKLMLLAADAFLEAGGLGGLSHHRQAWTSGKKPPKPLPMKQAASGLRHLSHEEMAGLKNQRRNQETSQQLLKKGWVQQPFQVVRGMDYMYNQQQAKAARSANDLGEEAEDGDEADAAAVTARQQGIEEKLRKSTFFRDMERQKKGIIHKLAKVSRVHEECEGQVIFRQGDRAACVYLLTKGSVGVLVQDFSKRPETPRQKDTNGLSTLTQAEQKMLRKTEETRFGEDRSPVPDPGRSSGVSGMSAKIREKIAPKQQILRRDLSKSQAEAAQVYSTVEGGNCFTKDSRLGAQVNVVSAGSVFGEVALLSDAPRSATIKCLETCEFVAVKAATFRKVLAEFTDVARACGILQSVETFNLLEERTPGIIHTLAKTAEFTTEAKGQVIFRQGDPGKSCFMLVKGQVTVHVRKGARGYANWPATPRMSGGDMPTLTEWRRSGLEAFDETARREEKKYGRPPREEQSFRTTEGFSTFGKESNYGDMVKWLREGSLFGELALQNSEPRSATIVCSQDCELLRLRKEDYLSVIQGTKQKIYFFDRFLAPFRHNADKRAQGALTQHPSLLFTDQIARDGQTLATEGIYADPKIFVLGASARAEFCRYKEPGDNPAYVLGNRPQSAPNQKANRCHPLLPGDLTRCKQDEELRESVMTFNPGGKEVQVHDVLKEGSIFGTMSACLNCSPEPFSIVARCPDETCTIYTLDGAGIQKMHPKLLEAVREVLSQDAARRMKLVHRDEKIQDVNVGSVDTW